MSFSGINKQWLLLGGVTLVGFCSTFLIPESPSMKPSRLATNLPDMVGDWSGKQLMIGEREMQILANDTSFERKYYTNDFDVTVPGVTVSIVFSGADLNNSIHRPEVCLRTQGWEFMEERYCAVPKVFGDVDLPVREIICRRIRLNPEGEPERSAAGELLYDWQLLQYTFIGHTAITPGHYSRTFHDIRDRLFRGYDQVWAYVTFSTIITAPYEELGVRIGLLDKMDAEQTRDFMADFIREVLPDTVSPREVKK